MLFGIGTRRLHVITDQLRAAHSLAVEQTRHGLAGVAPANKTASDVEAELVDHLKEYIKFVPEVTGSNRTYAKFDSYDKNSIQALAKDFNKQRRAANEHADEISLHIYKRVVKQTMKEWGVDKLYHMSYDHNV